MIRVACIQISPIFLDARKTWDKLYGFIEEASKKGADLITWGETLIPGYPVWISRSGGAKFNDPVQKKVYAKYWDEAIHLKNSPIIEEMKDLAKKHNVMLMGGILEKESGSTYCTLITIGPEGELLGRHRKIKPTYEERLVWADGDSLGLRTYPLKGTQVGGLNCWENWLPLARAALHLQEEMIHVAVWPGSIGLTKDITRFIALEGRSWVISVSGLLRPDDFNHLSEDEFPMKKVLMSVEKSLQNGGSMIVDPTGKIVAGPLVDEEGILYYDVDPLVAVEERQNLDISGHYSRFDIFKKPLAHKSRCQ
jgi:predicted amidohydrolase